jgi:hypothetical protein
MWSACTAEYSAGVIGLGGSAVVVDTADSAGVIGLGDSAVVVDTADSAAVIGPCTAFHARAIFRIPAFVRLADACR